MVQSTGCTSEKRVLEQPQAGEHGGLRHEHLDVTGGHSACARWRSRTWAAASRPLVSLSQSLSVTTASRDCAMARAVSEGAGPPAVRRTLTKWRGLRISAICVS